LLDQGSSFEELKKELQARGKELEDRTKSARDQIATLSSPFFRDGVVVMTHGYSRVVFSVLKYAAQREKRITVIATESMPQNNGVSLAQRLAAEGIPVQLISDSAAAHMMDQVDLVFVGAEAVVENGGIINNMGTYQLALVAKAHSKPFYVAAETYKMTRDFPLDQKSIPIQTYSHDHLQALPVSTTESKNRDACVPTWHQPMLDYTPPQYISLLFTDLTVLTPSAVSDELIKFDQVVPERNFS
jgi:translation initiation factor eIF-2B subunit alpha